MGSDSRNDDAGNHCRDQGNQPGYKNLLKLLTDSKSQQVEVNVQDRFAILTRFLSHLNDHRIPYVLTSVRPNAIMVQVRTPGDHWEIEFMDADWQDPMQVERYTSTGEIVGAEVLSEIFAILEIPDITSDLFPHGTSSGGPSR